jgi:outer membrane receptor protein involved in Fe transport
MKASVSIRRRISATALLAFGPIAQPAFAQVGAPGTPETAATQATGSNDIIVTAQRRAERLQDVPIAITAIGSEALDSARVESLFDIGLVAPGVKIQQYNGAILPMVRGVSSKIAGAGVDLPIATYIDGVYIGSPYGANFSFNNVERIEVLKGPQGTLFGRNATGGLIQIVTRDPEHTPGGTMDFTVARFGTLRGQAYVTGGVTDDLAMDLAVIASTQKDGWGVNIANGKDVNKLEHDVALRSKLLFTPTSELEVRISGDYAEQRNSRFAAQRPEYGVVPPAPFGPPFLGDDFDIASDYQPSFVSHGGGGSIRIDYDLGSVALASISAYRASSYELRFDSDYTAYPGRYASTDQTDRQFSQEVQLLSNSNSWLSWTLGGYYYWSDGKYDPVGTVTYGAPLTPGGPRSTTGRFTFADQSVESLSAYGQATGEIAPGLSVTLGLRYTDESRSLVASVTSVSATGVTTIATPEFERSVGFRKLTWRAAIDYECMLHTIAASGAAASTRW